MTNSVLKKRARALSKKLGCSYAAALQKLTASSKAPVPAHTALPSASVPLEPLPKGWNGFGARVVRVIELAEAEAKEARKRAA